MSDFQFIGGAYEAPSPLQDAQQCINWYVERDPAKNPGNPSMGIQPMRGEDALYPTPGVLLITTLDNPQEVRGMHVLPGGNVSIAVAGNVVYSLNSAFVPTRIGIILSSSGLVSITDNGTAVFLADGSNRYYSLIASPAIVTITDGAFNGANIVDVVDNFTIYNNPASNQWGCTNVGSVVSNGLNFAATLTAPGNVIGLIASRRQVFVMSDTTTEVWADVGSFPFPFQCVPGSSMQHGCVAAWSISRLGETFAFLAKDTRGQAIVVLMNGYSLKRISTHAIENAIASYAVISDARAFTYQEEGHEFYVLTFPSADVTWVYDLSMDIWHKRTWTDSNNVSHRIRANCMMAFGGKIIVGDWQNGNIYQLSRSTYTDNGQEIRRVRRCPHLVSDFKRQFFSDLQIQFQVGIGTQTGQGITPKAMLRWSDDGGITWSNERWANIGTVGQYKNRVIWRRLGQARDRVFEVVVTDPINAVIVSANLNAVPGAS